MGNLCGKPSSSKPHTPNTTGRVLGAAPPRPIHGKPTSTVPSSKSTKQSKPKVTGPGRTLGGSGNTTGGGTSLGSGAKGDGDGGEGAALGAREAAARAAEARESKAKAQANKGGLTAQLEADKRKTKNQLLNESNTRSRQQNNDALVWD